MRLKAFVMSGRDVRPQRRRRTRALADGDRDLYLIIRGYEPFEDILKKSWHRISGKTAALNMNLKRVCVPRTETIRRDWGKIDRGVGERNVRVNP
jgi:hypothetical protein